MFRLPPRSVSAFARLALPAALATAAVLAACGSSPDQASSNPGPVPIQTTVASTGAEVYTRSCARCHGADREGKRDAPKLDAVRMASLGEQALLNTIVYGKGRMRGFGGLSDAQVAALVTFLRDV